MSKEDVEMFKKKIKMYEFLLEFEKNKLEYIQEYFSNPEEYINSFECKKDGLGYCFYKVPGTDFFYKSKSDCDCQLTECPNYVICGNKSPKNILNSYYGLCYNCSVSYNICDKGKRKLNIIKNKICSSCNKFFLKSVEQPYCDDIICMDCFNITYLKPGTGECPCCKISQYKVLYSIRDN